MYTPSSVVQTLLDQVVANWTSSTALHLPLIPFAVAYDTCFESEWKTEKKITYYSEKVLITLWTFDTIWVLSVSLWCVWLLWVAVFLCLFLGLYLVSKKRWSFFFLTRLPAKAVPRLPAKAVPRLPVKAVPRLPAKAVSRLPAKAVPRLPAKAVPQESIWMNNILKILK